MWGGFTERYFPTLTIPSYYESDNFRFSESSSFPSDIRYTLLAVFQQSFVVCDHDGGFVPLLMTDKTKT